MLRRIAGPNCELVFEVPPKTGETLDLRSIVPVRRPISRSKTCVPGKVSDPSRNCTYHAESFNEFNALRVFLATASFACCKVQPFILRFVVNGKRQLYYPDFLAVDRRHVLVVEVKEDRTVDRPHVASRFATVRELLRHFSYEFRVWRVSEIVKQPRFANTGMVLRYRRSRITEPERERVRRALSGCTAVSFTDLSAASGVSIPAILRLVCDRVLHVDWWGSTLSASSLVSPLPIGTPEWPTNWRESSDSVLGF